MSLRNMWNKARLASLLVSLVLLVTLLFINVTQADSSIRTGVKVMIPVRLYDPIDLFRGSYLAIRPVFDYYESGLKTGLVLDKNGVVVKLQYDELDHTSLIVNEFVLERYYFEEVLTSKMDRVIREWSDSLVIEAYVNDNNLTITGLYAGGVPVLDRIEQLDEDE